MGPSLDMDGLAHIAYEPFRITRAGSGRDLSGLLPIGVRPPLADIRYRIEPLTVEGDRGQPVHAF